MSCGTMPEIMLLSASDCFLLQSLETLAEVASTSWSGVSLTFGVANRTRPVRNTSVIHYRRESSTNFVSSKIEDRVVELWTSSMCTCVVPVLIVMVRHRLRLQRVLVRETVLLRKVRCRKVRCLSTLPNSDTTSKNLSPMILALSRLLHT